MTKKNKDKPNKNHVQFFLTFFETDEYSEKEINGWWLIKQWDGNAKRWTVHLYPKDSYENYKNARGEMNPLFEEIRRQDEHIKNI